MSQPPPQQPPPPGWHPDPSGAPGQLRWWDGQQWTAQTMPEQGMPGPGGPGGTGGPAGPAGPGAPTAPGGPAGPDFVPSGGPAPWGGDPWSGQAGYRGGPPPGAAGWPEGPGQFGGQPQKGLSTGVIVAIIAALVVVVGGGAVGGAYYLLTRDGGGGATAGRNPTPNQSPQAALPVSYTDEQTGITLRLPEGWEQASAAPMAEASAGAFTAPYPCPYGGDESATCYKGTVLTGPTPESEAADTAQKKAFFTSVVVGGTGYAVDPGQVSGDNFEIAEEEELTVGGKSAYRMQVTMEIPGSEVSALLDTVVVDDDGQWVYVMFASDQVEGAPPTSVFDQVLPTVSFS